MRPEIRPMTFDDLERAPNFDALQDEYASESSLDGLGRARAQMAMYKALEAAGTVQLIGAFVGGVLVGFVTVMASELPHYGARVAVTESLFVAAAHRATGAGLMLLTAAEDAATEMGAVGLFVSAPTGGALATVMAGMKAYRDTNRVFFKGLAS